MEYNNPHSQHEQPSEHGCGEDGMVNAQCELLMQIVATNLPTDYHLICILVINQYNIQ